MSDPNAVSVRETLVFYGITASGTLQPREMFRFMENTGPQWWLPMSGMPRNEFWRSRRRTLVARTAKIRLVSSNCKATDKIVVHHVIRHGHRTRLNRPPEYGFLDDLRVVRESDGALLAELLVDTVWLEFPGGEPRVATTPPDGLEHLDEELPAVEPPPAIAEPDQSVPFRWTVRETDFNGHVSFPSYYERAENAIADAGLPPVTTGVWQSWYQQESFGNEAMRLSMKHIGDGGYLFGFAGETERRARVTVRFTREV